MFLEVIWEDSPGLLKIAEWRNQVPASLRAHTETPIRMEHQNAWVKRWTRSGDEYFSIKTFLQETIGYGGLDKICNINKTAELSLLINPERHGEGFGKQAVRCLLTYAFEFMELNCVFIEVYRTTDAWIFWEKCGFIQEGDLKARKFWNGAYYDSVAACLLREE